MRGAKKGIASGCAILEFWNFFSKKEQYLSSLSPLMYTAGKLVTYTTQKLIQYGHKAFVRKKYMKVYEKMTLLLIATKM